MNTKGIVRFSAAQLIGICFVALVGSAGGFQWGTEEYGTLVAVTFFCTIVFGLVASIPDK